MSCYYVETRHRLARYNPDVIDSVRISYPNHTLRLWWTTRDLFEIGLNAQRALVDKSTQQIGEVLHGCTQTRVRLPASPNPLFLHCYYNALTLVLNCYTIVTLLCFPIPPARIDMPWPGEHPSLVSFTFPLLSCGFVVLCSYTPGHNPIWRPLPRQLLLPDPLTSSCFCQIPLSVFDFCPPFLFIFRIT
jgi:hypothetical protein